MTLLFCWPSAFARGQQENGCSGQFDMGTILVESKNGSRGRRLADHLGKKYGQRAIQMLNDPNNHMYVTGRKVGIEFTSKRKIYPTQKAHALMEYLKEQDNNKANEVMEEMYKRYFEQGQNINDDSVLKEIAVKFGVKEEEAKDAIEDGRRLMEVDEKDYIAKRRMGISGVPFFRIEQNSGGRPVGFSGAQPIDIIAECLEEAAEE